MGISQVDQRTGRDGRTIDTANIGKPPSPPTPSPTLPFTKEEKAAEPPASPPLPAHHPYSDRLERWLRRALDEALYIDHPREGGGLGGLPAMLAERGKWDWRLVREHILPMLGMLNETIARFRKEMEANATTTRRS